MKHPRRIEIDEEENRVRVITLKPGNRIVQNLEVYYAEGMSSDRSTVKGLKVFLRKSGSDEMTVLWESEE